jgi:hypothetical protein
MRLSDGSIYDIVNSIWYKINRCPEYQNSNICDQLLFSPNLKPKNPILFPILFFEKVALYGSSRKDILNCKFIISN